MNIDYMLEDILKTATLKSPTEEEAKKENLPQELQKIECLNCGYEGRTNDKGECPRCFSIGGIKPTASPITEKDKKNDDWTEKPISYQEEADLTNKETNPY